MHVIVNYHSLVPLNLSAQSSFMILCQLEFMFINFNFWLNNNNILKKNYSFMLCPEHSSKKSFIGMKKEVEPRLIGYLRVGRVDNVSKSQSHKVGDKAMLNEKCKFSIVVKRGSKIFKISKTKKGRIEWLISQAISGMKGEGRGKASLNQEICLKYGPLFRWCSTAQQQ